MLLIKTVAIGLHGMAAVVKVVTPSSKVSVNVPPVMIPPKSRVWMALTPPPPVVVLTISIVGKVPVRPVVAPAVSWTGFYFGGHVGVGSQTATCAYGSGDAYPGCASYDGFGDYSAPAYASKNTSFLAGVEVGLLHRREQELDGQPMRRILEARGVEDQGLIRRRVVACDRREVTGARLPHGAARVVDDHRLEDERIG